VTGVVSSNDTCMPHTGCRKSAYQRYRHIERNDTTSVVLVDEMRGVVVPTLEATLADNEVAAVSIAPPDKPLAKGTYHSKPVDIRVSLVEGQETQYNIKLSVRPNYPVTIIPVVSNTYQLSVEPAKLVFTSRDYYEDKQVTVHANGNFVHDFARNQSVTHIVLSNETGLAECNTASKQGNGVLYEDEKAPCKTKYNGTKVGVVYLEISDDDISGVNVAMPPASKDGLITIIDSTVGIMVEGSSMSYNIVLDSEPMEDVSVDITAALLAAGSSPIAWDQGDEKLDAKLQVLINPNKVLFTKKSWNVKQQVIVVARDNAVFEGFEARQLNISHVSHSIDPNYELVPISQIAINITDDDAGCQLDAPVSDPKHSQGELPVTLKETADGTGLAGQYTCIGYMNAAQKEAYLKEVTKGLAHMHDKGLTTCETILPRATSPGIFGRPTRPPPNSVFLHERRPALMVDPAGASGGVASSDKIALAKLSAHPFQSAYLSGGVCRCELGRGGRNCMYTEREYKRLELTIEAQSGFDASFTNGRSWTALALSLGVEEKDVYVAHVRNSNCLFSFKLHCVEVVVDLTGPAYELNVMKMVQTDAPNVRDLQIKDIHIVSNWQSGGLLVGNSVYPLSSVSSLVFLAWLFCSCYYGCKKGQAERKKVAAIKKEDDAKERKKREEQVDPLMGKEDEESKEEERN